MADSLTSGLPTLPSNVSFNTKNILSTLCASSIGSADINERVVRRLTILDDSLAHARTEVRSLPDPIAAFNAAYNDLDTISKLPLSADNKRALGAQATQLKNLTADRDRLSQGLQDLEHEVEDLVHQRTALRDLYQKAKKASPQQRDELQQEILKRAQEIKVKTDAVRKKIKEFSEQQVAPYQQQIQQIRTQVDIQSKAVAGMGIKLDTKGPT